jgi:hypothetical protein
MYTKGIQSAGLRKHEQFEHALDRSIIMPLFIGLHAGPAMCLNEVLRACIELNQLVHKKKVYTISYHIIYHIISYHIISYHRITVIFVIEISIVHQLAVS